MSVELIPYLIMDGNSKEAIKFYEETLDAKLLFSETYGDFSDEQEDKMPAESKELIMHATLQIGQSVLMLSDAYPGYPHQKGNQVTICITTKDIAQTKQIFEGLSEGGQVEMPLQVTGFSPSYGKVVDQFGVLFQVFTHGNQ